MGEKWEIKKLVIDVLENVRRFYHDTDTWPSLRRVQYIYANTPVESPMRQLLVSCVARMLVLSEEESMPPHWEKALRRNGQLAVDIILCVQKWRFEPERVPDVREESVVPIYEEAKERREVKQEANGDGEGDGDATMVNGVNGQHEANGEANGHGDGDEGQQIKQEQDS